MTPGAQLRWWFVDRFTASPQGRRTQVSGERFADLMARLAVQAEVEVPDRLGDAASRSFSLRFDRPRLFRVGDVIASSPILAELHSQAEKLKQEKSASPDAAASRVEKVVGEGRLSRKLRGQPAPKAASAGRFDTLPLVMHGSDDAEGARPLTVDDIFGDAEIRPGTSRRSEVRSGLDALVGALLGTRKPPPEIPAETRHSAAEVIEAAVVQTALDVLGHPDVASLEASWRGLKLVMGSTLGHDHLAVELVDADPSDLVSALRFPDSPRDRPDAIFTGPQLGDADTVRALAQLGERMGVPIVISVDEGLPFADLANVNESDPSPAWAELAAEAPSQWLCAVMNPIALVHEETVLGPRLLGGSPAFALAAMLASAQDRRRGLQGVAGPATSLVAPAAHDIEVGPGESRTIPTAYFAPVRLQETGARIGVVVLGSGLGTDRVLVVETPMVHRTQASLVERIRQAHAGRVSAL